MKNTYWFIKPFLISTIALLLFVKFSYKTSEYTIDMSGTDEKCGTVEYNEMLMDKYPGFKANLESFEQNVKNYQFVEDQSVVVIPVVVHVVWNQAVQNISDAQIQSQLAVLNDDFRKLNSDTNLIPEPWKGIAADFQIQFCLAQRDPSGNPTTGIVRTYTSRTSFGAGDTSIKYTSLGGSNIWNRDKYLNLWSCNLGGGLLGYAQFPGGPPGTDGVVIGYKCFGTTGAVVPPYDKGRTATHEIGHWLNLRHIWGDEPQCNNDDFVSDTPLQQTALSGCPYFPETDNCTPSYPGVMFVNYMDYTDDECMMMFTNGQNVRVQSALNSVRSSLKTSDGCQPVGGGSTILQENFEPTVFPPADWLLGYNGTLYWSRSTLASGNGNGLASARFEFYEAPEYTVQNMITKSFTAAGNGSYLFFDHAYATYQTEVDSLVVWTSTNSGSNYSVLAILPGGPNVGTGMVTAPPSSDAFAPTSSQWGSKSYVLPQGTNKIAFMCISHYGNNLYLDNIRVGIPNSINADNNIIPEKINLYQNYPNPFNPSTTIKFEIPKDSYTELKVYNIQGREVITLISKQLKTGMYEVNWNASDNPSGVYFYKLITAEFTETKRMVLLK